MRTEVATPTPARRRRAHKPDGRRTVGRRTVFFISGFDPRGPAWYHGTYRREAERQSRLSGTHIAVGDRIRRGPEITAWSVAAETDGVETATDYVLLRWDDIVRRYWPRGTVRLWGVMASNLYHYLASGVLWRLLRTAWPTFICAFYPSAFVLTLALLTFICGLAVGLFAAWLAGWPVWIMWPAGVTACLAGTAAGMPILDHKLLIHWLTRIYAFNLLQARRQAPDLERRLDDFARHIVAAAQAGDADEILVVGHSTGAQTAASVLARALDLDPDLGRHGPAISFMTLGSSISMLSWQPEAGWFRDALKRLAWTPDIDWIDFTIAQDGACFALHDPVSSAGLDHPPDAEPKPKLLSLKLFDLFSPAEFDKVRRRWFRLHFQYLMAGERLADYDYFAITAGPLTLADRFAHRPTTRNFDRFKLRILGR